METYQNYQLYRTNVLLGGQMKYDLVIDSHNGNLVVSNFHIRPISKSCPFGVRVQDNLLRYTHRENIKRYYNRVSSSFYKDFINQSIYPVGDESGSVSDDTYNMGCSRMDYGLYNKQFEFLCPLWLENVNDLRFQFNIYTPDGDSPIFSRYLDLVEDNSFTEYHNSVVKYFGEHFDYLGVSSGNNDVMNIQPSKNFASISGLNVVDGLKQVKILQSAIKNMFNREIPLIEWDHLLIRNFEDSKMIANQLFNFNICFNPEDIIPQNIYHMIVGGSLRLEVVVYADQQPLKCVDFYTNYDFIAKKDCSVKEYMYREDKYEFFPVELDVVQEEKNVLDYMKDYTCIDYIDKNKLSQPIIHWSLVGNNDYICNIYEGFSGFNGEAVAKHLYDNTSNILIKDNNESLNSLTWCNMISVGTDTFLYDSILQRERNFFKDHSSKFDVKNGGWVNNIKYNGLGDEAENCPIIHMIVVEASSDTVGQGSGLKNRVTNLGSDDMVAIFTTDVKEWTFLKTINFLNEWIDRHEDDEMTFKCKMLVKFLSHNRNLNGLETIRPSTSLSAIKADSPSLFSDEIVYYKKETPGEYVMRYFGKITPTFIHRGGDINFNYRYSRKYLSREEALGYKLFYDSGFQPKYPSIGYWNIDRCKEDYVYKGDKNLLEYKFYNDNKISALLPRAIIQFGTNTDVIDHDIVKSKINEMIYKTNNISDKNLDKVFNLYDIKHTLIKVERVEETNKYTHQIELTLK